MVKSLIQNGKCKETYEILNAKENTQFSYHYYYYYYDY